MRPCVVCGIDDSAAPLRVAKRLAERLGARLVLVHVTREAEYRGEAAAAETPLLVTATAGVPYPEPPLSAEAVDELYRRERERLERLAEEHGIAGAEPRVEVGGSAADALRRAAREEGADMLVVGSRGCGTLRAALLGSTSHALASDAPCPVVVVPPGEPG